MLQTMCGAYGTLEQVSQHQREMVSSFRGDIEAKLQERMNILLPDMSRVTFVGSKTQVVAGTNHQLHLEIHDTPVIVVIFEKLPCYVKDGIEPFELKSIEPQWK